MRFVSILVESKSDCEIMNETGKILEKFSVAYEFVISSACGSADRTRSYVKEAEAKGAKVFIAAASKSAHLAGFVASLSTKPVVGVPLKGGLMDGMDALLSTVQMPAGVPVASLSTGRDGAINAAYLAMQILAIEDEELGAKLQEDRILKAKKVQSDSALVEKRV